MPPNPGFKPPENKNDENNDAVKMTAEIIGVAAVGYLIYVGVKWIIAGVTAPVTGGGSLIIAGVTP